MMCSGFIPSIFPGKFCEDTLGKYRFIRVCSGWPSGLSSPLEKLLLESAGLFAQSNVLTFC